MYCSLILVSDGTLFLPGCTRGVTTPPHNRPFPFGNGFDAEDDDEERLVRS
jgi:hypothetical protein